MNEIEEDTASIDTANTDPASTDSESWRLPTPRRKDIGWLLVGGGIVGALVTLLRGRRSAAEWAVHFGLIGAGAGVLLQRRQAHMDQAKASILAELDTLDPIARAQVLKAVADQQLGRLSG